MLPSAVKSAAAVLARLPSRELLGSALHRSWTGQLATATTTAACTAQTLNDAGKQSLRKHRDEFRKPCLEGSEGLQDALSRLRGYVAAARPSSPPTSEDLNDAVVE